MMEIRSMKRFLFLTIALLSLNDSLFAQQFIEGILIDADTKEPVPFANLVLMGTYRGTATNYDGEFSLHVPKENSTDSVIISAVGYTNMRLFAPDLIKKGFVRLEIHPIAYEMEDVTVEAKSQFYATVLKRACEKIADNYYQSPFNYDIYYRNTHSVNGKLQKERQAAVRMYDSKGYEQQSAFQAYKERGYKFLQVRRNFELNSLSDGSTQLDDLLEFDVMRQFGNVLNPLYVYDKYEIDLKRMTKIDGDSVWVISYKCKEPSLALSGDYYATSYSGEVFVKKKDYAVIKYTANYTSSNYSSLGRSLYVNPDKQNYQPLSISYTVTTNYRSFNGTYFLSSVLYERNHKWKHKKDRSIRTEKINAEMLVTEIKLKQPEVISNRAYYEEIPFDEQFWKSFSILKDEKKGKR